MSKFSFFIHHLSLAVSKVSIVDGNYSTESEYGVHFIQLQEVSSIMNQISNYASQNRLHYEDIDQVFHRISSLENRFIFHSFPSDILYLLSKLYLDQILQYNYSIKKEYNIYLYSMITSHLQLWCNLLSNEEESIDSFFPFITNNITKEIYMRTIMETMKSLLIKEKDHMDYTTILSGCHSLLIISQAKAMELISISNIIVSIIKEMIINILAGSYKTTNLIPILSLNQSEIRSQVNLLFETLMKTIVDKVRKLSHILRVKMQTYLTLSGTSTVISNPIIMEETNLLVGYLSILSILYSSISSSSSSTINYIPSLCIEISSSFGQQYAVTITQLTHTILDRVLLPIHKIMELLFKSLEYRDSNQSTIPSIIENRPKRSLRPSSDLHANMKISLNANGKNNIFTTSSSSSSSIDKTWIRGQSLPSSSSSSWSIHPIEILRDSDAMIRCFCFRLIGDLAASSIPGGFVPNWTLLMTESITVESRFLDIFESLSNSNNSNNNTVIEDLVEKLRSPLLTAITNNKYSIINQVESIRCLRLMISNIVLSLNKWFKLLPNYISNHTNHKYSNNNLSSMNTKSANINNTTNTTNNSLSLLSTENRSSSVPIMRRVDEKIGNHVHEASSSSSNSREVTMSNRRVNIASKGFSGDKMTGNLIKVIVIIIHLLNTTDDESILQETLSIVRLVVDNMTLPIFTLKQVNDLNKLECNMKGSILEEVTKTLLFRILSQSLKDPANTNINMPLSSSPSSSSSSSSYLSSSSSSFSTIVTSQSIELDGKLKDMFLNHRKDITGIHRLATTSNLLIPTIQIFCLEWLHDFCKKSSYGVIYEMFQSEAYSILPDHSLSNQRNQFYVVALMNQCNTIWSNQSLESNQSILAAKSRELILTLCTNYYPIFIQNQTWLKSIILSYCHPTFMTSKENIIESKSIDNSSNQSNQKSPVRKDSQKNSGSVTAKKPFVSILSNHLFGLKMLYTLLDKMKKSSIYSIQTTRTIEAGNQKLSTELCVLDFYPVELFEMIYTGCISSDHQVRSTAIGILGKLPTVFYERYPIENQLLLLSNTTIANTKEQLSFISLDMIIFFSKDTIGTVRTAAFQSLGEIISDNGLSHIIAAVSNQRIETMNSTVANHILFTIINTIVIGCKDSKLAVRLQSMWALGNLLLLLLPYRHQEVFAVNRSLSPTGLISPKENSTNININTDTFDSKSMIQPIHDMNHPTTDIDNAKKDLWILSDQMWIELSDLCLNSLEDSDKLLASSVRCLGFLSAGLSPWDYIHFAHTSDIITSIIRRALLSSATEHHKSGESLASSLTANVLSSSTSSSLSSNISFTDFHYVLRQSITGRNPKLIHTATQTLGIVGWVLITRGDYDSDGVAPRVTTYIETLRIVHAEMLRFGSSKTQLQACKALITLTYRPEQNLVSENKSIFQDKNIRRVESLVRIFETVLVTLPPIKDFILSMASSNLSSHQQQQTALTIEQDRKLSLSRMLIILVWILIKDIFSATVTSMNTELEENTVSVLSYHINDLIDFLKLFLVDINEDTMKTKRLKSFRQDVIQLDELSLTLPPLIQTAPLDFKLLPNQDTSLPKDLAKDICCRLLLIYDQGQQKLMNVSKQPDHYPLIQSTISISNDMAKDDPLSAALKQQQHYHTMKFNDFFNREIYTELSTLITSNSHNHRSVDAISSMAMTTTTTMTENNLLDENISLSQESKPDIIKSIENVFEDEF